MPSSTRLLEVSPLPWKMGNGFASVIPALALQRRIYHAFLSMDTRDTMEEWTKRQVGLVCICVNAFVNGLDMKSGRSRRLTGEHVSYLIFQGNILKWNKFLQNCKI